MRCAACGHENREGAKFCRECAAPLAHPTSCPKCGTPSEGGQKFCDSCGHRIAEISSLAASPDPRSYTPKHLAEKILTTRSALEGERKQVTVLFADVKGSMELAEQVDAESWHRILDGFFQILSEGVHRFEGTVNQFTGDGIMALFGARVLALANAGEVLVSHTVQGILVGSRYRFDERGVHELKGVPGKWPVFAIGAGKQP